MRKISRSHLTAHFKNTKKCLTKINLFLLIENFQDVHGDTGNVKENIRLLEFFNATTTLHELRKTSSRVRFLGLKSLQAERNQEIRIGSEKSNTTGA